MQIFIARNNQQLGPFDLPTIQAQLSDGSLAPTDLAWYEGAAGWAPLSTVPGIVISAPPASAGPPPPPKVTPPAPPRSSPPVPPVATPSVPAPAPIPVIPPIAPAPSVAALTPPLAQPQKKSALKVVGSILVGILVISLGLLKIVRSTTRLFADKSTTRTYSTPSATQKPSNIVPSPTQKPSSQPVTQQPAAQYKTTSYPSGNPRFSFQVSKEAQGSGKDNGCFLDPTLFVLCADGNDGEITSLGTPAEIKVAKEKLKKEISDTMQGIVRKNEGKDLQMTGVGDFKTAKGIPVLYFEATFTYSDGRKVIMFMHVFPAKKGTYTLTNISLQEKKSAVIQEMRRIMDSVVLL